MKHWTLHKEMSLQGNKCLSKAQGKTPSQQKRNADSRSGVMTTAKLREEDVPNSTQPAKDRVAKHHEGLCATELEESLAKHVAITNVLHGSKDVIDSTKEEEDLKKPLQGPVVEVEIHQEGQPASYGFS